ncbi:hypothetical protein Tco_1550914, partial [Tanacetum coccineum]
MLVQVMAALIISISFVSSKESMGSHASRVILFGAIPTIIHVIPEVPIVLADPIVTPEEDSLPPPTPDLPLVSPFLCSNNSEADGESEPAEQRPERHESLTPSFEFPLAPVVAPPRIRRRPVPYCFSTITYSCFEVDNPYSADLLPPHKMFRDLYSPEDSGEEHVEVDTTDGEAVADVGISEGVVAHTDDDVGMGVEIAASDVREDDEEFEAETSAADIREITVDPLVIGDSFES